MIHPHRRSEQGTVLLFALLTMVLVAGMATVMLTTARVELQQADTQRLRSETLQLAESSTVVAEAQILKAVANTLPPPIDGVVTLGQVQVPFTVGPVGKDTTTQDANGIVTLHKHYLVDATADQQNYIQPVHRVLDVGLTPIFQFAIFYEKDLELLPGPSMTLSGRVHSNSDIYVGTGNNSTLTIASNYFRSVGRILRMRKDKSSPTSGNVDVQNALDGSYDSLQSQSDLAFRGVPSASGYDSQFTGYDANGDGDLDDSGDWQDFAVGALDRWDGTIQTGAHGMRRIEPPSVGSIQRYEGLDPFQGDYVFDPNKGDYTYVGQGNGDYRQGRYYANAGLVIEDGQAYQGGAPITLPQGTLTEQIMYDAREGTSVRVTQVDVALLNQSGYFPDNGLIYASRADSSPSGPNGVRLVNAAELAAPLTVASENPVYVWGDYNTVNKKPAAVISDAVNLLSNNWDDTKKKGQLPKAAETWYNFAMITGGNETQGSNYSGGFENLPRFHENWSGVNSHIMGSFVKIYASLIGTGKWRYGGDRYTAPRRLWDYDQSFNDPTQLPPFTPNVAQVKSSGWWQ